MASGRLCLVYVALIWSVATACNNSEDARKKLLVRAWELREIRMNDQAVTAEQLKLKKQHWEFFADGKYKVDFDFLSEEGTWKIEEDELITYTTSPSVDTNALAIGELTAEKVVLQSDVQGKKAYLVLVPAN